MTNQEALRMAYSKRKDSAGEERDFLNTIIQALEQTSWISVIEKLPEEAGTYMTTVDYHGIAVGQRYYHGKWIGWEDDCVIAWMPLPEPYVPEINVGKIGESEDKELEEIDFIQPKKIVGHLISTDVLDKIRERIALERLGYPPSAGYYRGIEKALQIIDKYKKESEVQNA